MGRGRRAVKIAIVVVAAIVVVGVLAQVLLPRIAAGKVREEVEKYGNVKSVEVKAWPAVKLVWKRADEVRVSAGRLKASPDQAVALLKEAEGVERMRVSVESAEVGGLRLTDAKLEKNGRALRVRGVVSEEAIERALPEGFEVAFVKSEGGTIGVRASGGLFGVSASVEAVAAAEDGKLVARPTGLFLSALKLTVFDDPNVYVEGVEAQPLGRGGGEGARYELSMWASLR